MRWFQKASSSSSTTLTSPSLSSLSTCETFRTKENRSHGQLNNCRSCNDAHNSNGSRAGYRNYRHREEPRLTRGRKLRHLTDQDLLIISSSAQSKRCISQHDADFGATSSSVSPTTTASTGFSPPIPHPLPLPYTDTPSTFEVDHRTEGPTAASPLHPLKSSFGSTRNGGQFEIKAYKPRRPDLSSGEISQYSKPPVNSAPTSPFSSPSISPQRSSFNSPERMTDYMKMVCSGNQAWSAPELAMLDMQGLPPPAFVDISAFSNFTSPLHSPHSKNLHASNLRSPRGTASSAKPATETSIPRKESSTNQEVHPLPLPPGAAAHAASIKRLESAPFKSLWQKGKLIGRGTFGSVYVASNRISGALCAMKEVEIFPDDPNSTESINQLEQEIKILSQLQHQNIVQHYGSEIVEDHFYIYLEYVHPGSIHKYIHDHCQAITEDVVRSFTRHIVSGLAYLHGKKTIHRDIKGANLLVDASGVVKLADFGMSKLLSGQLTHLSMKGSPHWMAPELMQSTMQQNNSSDLAFAVDIWSLGCTIIEMFTGKPPWSEYEGPAAMFKVMRDTPPIPETLSPDGKDFLGCCLRRNPAERLTASSLLDHRWLRCSVNGIKLSDTHSGVRPL